jgi:hypothetical protein
MSQNDDEDEFPYIIEIVLGVISCICSLLIFLKFLINKEVRSYAFELIVCLSLASLFNTISYLINYIASPKENVNETLCNFQAFTMMWFESSQTIWATIITIYTFNATQHYYRDDHIHFSRRIVTLLIGFGLSLTMPIIGLFNDNLGEAGRWCWINVDKSSAAFIVVYFSIIWFMIFTAIIIAFVIKCRRKDIKSTDQESADRFINKLLFYPIVAFIGWLPGTIFRLDSKLFSDSVKYLQIIQVVVIQLQGTLYGSIVLYDVGIKDILTGFCCLFDCCSRKHEKISLDKISLRSSTVVIGNESF